MCFTQFFLAGIPRKMRGPISPQSGRGTFKGKGLEMPTLFLNSFCVCDTRRARPQVATLTKPTTPVSQGPHLECTTWTLGQEPDSLPGSLGCTVGRWEDGEHKPYCDFDPVTEGGFALKGVRQPCSDSS